MRRARGSSCKASSSLWKRHLHRCRSSASGLATPWKPLSRCGVSRGAGRSWQSPSPSGSSARDPFLVKICTGGTGPGNGFMFPHMINASARPDDALSVEDTEAQFTARVDKAMVFLPLSRRRRCSSTSTRRRSR